MRRRLMDAVLAAAVIAGGVTVAGQTAAPANPQNFLPIGRPANLAPSAVPDLSGDWALMGIGQSLSAADTAGYIAGVFVFLGFLYWIKNGLKTD